MTMAVPPIRDQHSPSEDALILAVRDALASYDPVRIWGDCIQLDAHRSTIIISGNVRNHSAKEVAGRIVKQARGVTAVENRLVVDLDTELQVAQALAADSRTQSAFPGVLVGVVFGVAYLKGTVEKADIKSAAGEIAAKTPGVRSVSNELTVASPKEAATPVPAAKKSQEGVRPA